MTSFKDDVLASIVVFLVALPLCMGIAIASGAPASAGLVTGIIGGIVVGSLSGSALQVSGPAAGLSVLIWELIDEHGIAALGPIVLAAGALQVAAGALSLGQWFRAVSPAVIRGMLAGIGVLIVVSQFHVMVDDAPRGGGIANLLAIPEAVWKGVAPPDGSAHHLAASIGLLTIATMMAWKTFAPKAWQLVPAPLAAVVLATGLAAWFDLPENGVRCVELPANLLTAIRPLDVASLRDSASWEWLTTAVALALVASAETLLSAAAVDQMHTGPRTKFDRELAAQGVGNMLCGLLGALPMTGVVVRSAANVQAGARTRCSAILHGVWLLLFVSLAPWVLEWVPTSSLAAVLVYTGAKLVDVGAVKTLWSFGKGEVAIYVVTVAMIVGVNLLAGILAGLALAAVKLLLTFTRLKVRVQHAPGRVTLILRGAATFLGLPKLAAALEEIPAASSLHIQFDELSFIDHACLDMLMAWQRQHESTGGRLHVDWDGLTARFRDARPRGGDPRRERLTA